MRKISAIGKTDSGTIGQSLTLSKHSFWSAVRIVTWIERFLTNSKSKKQVTTTGPLITKEIRQPVEWYIKRVQDGYSNTDEFQEDKLRLNLQPNTRGLYECRGRIQGEFPLYLPPDVHLQYQRRT